MTPLQCLDDDLCDAAEDLRGNPSAQKIANVLRRVAEAVDRYRAAVVIGKADDDLTAEDIGALLDHGQPVEVVGPRILGWSCPHFSMTSAGLTAPPTGWCGCQMSPIPHTVAV